MKLIKLFRLSLSEGSTICFANAFSARTCQSLEKKSSEYGKQTFPFPSHSQHLAPRPPTLPAGAPRALNFTGFSIKGTRVTTTAEIPQVKSLSSLHTLSGGDHKRFLIVSYPSRAESNSIGSVAPPSSLPVTLSGW